MPLVRARLRRKRCGRARSGQRTRSRKRGCLTTLGTFLVHMMFDAHEFSLWMGMQIGSKQPNHTLDYILVETTLKYTTAVWACVNLPSASILKLANPWQQAITSTRPMNSVRLVFVATQYPRP